MRIVLKPYIELFFAFFKIGAFTFGGGYAMIPLIRNEAVFKRKWLNDTDFVEMLAVAQSMPGPVALNTALFIGNRRQGFKGSLAAGFGVILPSFIIILLIALFFTQFKDNPLVERIFKGIRPAVVALIAAPLIQLGKSTGITLKTLWIPIAVALSVWLLNVSPILIIVLSIAGGIAYYKFIVQNGKERGNGTD
jgi:chromate transporter